MALRFERASVYEGAQVGVETTPGTPVAANKRLLGMQLEIENMTDITTYRPQGSKFDTNLQLGKEWSELKLSGIQCFNDLLYQLSGWLTGATPTTPASNGVYTLTITATSGTVQFNFNGQSTTPANISGLTTMGMQTAIAGLSTVGAGNVVVTGASSPWTITFQGALDGTSIALTTTTAGLSGGTVALTTTAATNTRRWVFKMANAGPDNVQTYTFEKGAQGVANMAQQAAFGFLTGMSFKNTKKEATITGTGLAQVTADPFTMTTNPTDVTCVPLDPANVGVWFGSTALGLTKMDRILEVEWGINNRAGALVTLNDSDPSFSNRVELAPEATCRFFMEQDSNGQAMLANLRARQKQFVLLRTKGALIEAGFPYRMEVLLSVGLTKPNTEDIDGVYGRRYDASLMYDSGMTTAVQVTIDSPVQSL